MKKLLLVLALSFLLNLDAVASDLPIPADTPLKFSVSGWRFEAGDWLRTVVYAPLEPVDISSLIEEARRDHGWTPVGLPTSQPLVVGDCPIITETQALKKGSRQATLSVYQGDSTDTLVKWETVIGEEMPPEVNSTVSLFPDLPGRPIGASTAAEDKIQFVMYDLSEIVDWSTVESIMVKHGFTRISFEGLVYGPQKEAYAAGMVEQADLMFSAAKEADSLLRVWQALQGNAFMMAEAFRAENRDYIIFSRYTGGIDTATSLSNWDFTGFGDIGWFAEPFLPAVPH